jgi:hypothetical protein
MKMSWGKGIIIVIGAFISGMTIMVYTSVKNDTELVTKNYYEKEIKYQEQIDKINNSKGLIKNLKIEALSDKLVIKFPDEEKGNDINGEILFYRPSDAKKDFTVPVELGKNSEQVITTGEFEKGAWIVKVNWSSKGMNYYNEETIMVQ